MIPPRSFFSLVHLLAPSSLFLPRSRPSGFLIWWSACHLTLPFMSYPYAGYSGPSYGGSRPPSAGSDRGDSSRFGGSQSRSASQERRGSVSGWSFLFLNFSTNFHSPSVLVRVNYGRSNQYCRRKSYPPARGPTPPPLFSRFRQASDASGYSQREQPSMIFPPPKYDGDPWPSGKPARLFSNSAGSPSAFSSGSVQYSPSYNVTRGGELDDPAQRRSKRSFATRSRTTSGPPGLSAAAVPFSPFSPSVSRSLPVVPSVCSSFVFVPCTFPKR